MRQNEHLLLSILGDGNFHSYSEALYLYTFTLKQRDSKDFKKTLETLLRRNWVYHEQKTFRRENQSFRIGKNGDLAFREEQIRRSGDYTTFKYEPARPVAM